MLESLHDAGKAVKLRHSNLSIPSEGVWLDGRLSHAPDVRGLAVLALPNAHLGGDSGESRVSEGLQQSGYATLLVGLLTHHEGARDPDACYNVPQMARRLLGVADWIGHQPALAPLSIGLIGASTASAAVIRAAWKAPERFDAIVCQAGRPDLAGATPLRALTSPIRIVVGNEDPSIARLHQAFELIGAERDWQQVDGGADLFGDARELERFTRQATDWLDLKLAPPRTDASLVGTNFVATDPTNE